MQLDDRRSDNLLLQYCMTIIKFSKYKYLTKKTLKVLLSVFFETPTLTLQIYSACILFELFLSKNSKHMEFY